MGGNHRDVDVAPVFTLCQYAGAVRNETVLNHNNIY